MEFKQKVYEPHISDASRMDRYFTWHNQSNSLYSYEQYLENIIHTELISRWERSVRGNFVDRLKLNTIVKYKWVDMGKHGMLEIRIEMSSEEYLLYQLLPDIIDEI